jgi:nucleotide-binding universal stress UspA family protein
MYKRILSAIDSTPHARTVLTHTQYLAQLTAASVHVLHVHSLRAIHAGLPVVAAQVAGVAIASMPPAELAVGAAAHQLVDQAVARLIAAGVTSTGEVLDAREERAAELIGRRAKELAVQLIVVGAQYRKRLLMPLRSTVTDRVCRRPCCPVLVVP